MNTSVKKKGALLIHFLGGDGFQLGGGTQVQPLLPSGSTPPKKNSVLNDLTLYLLLELPMLDSYTTTWSMLCMEESYHITNFQI